MAEVEMRAIHAVTVEMHGGMLTLAAVCVLVLMAELTYHRFLPGKLPRVERLVAKVSRLAGPAAVLAAIGGVGGLIASAITGYLLTPGASLTDDPMAMNKVMVTTFSIELWTTFIILALVHGERLWKTRPLAVLASSAAFAGYAASIVGGSLGGTMAGKGSVLDPFWELVGVDIHHSWILTVQFAILIAVVVNLIGIALIGRSLRARSEAPSEDPASKAS